uniref:Uncharacterized protein n=1 Tax=Pristionchus pacificus TaxID=54126 RepID=A0A2A6BSJ7_PRIPA|eukprot:PDM68884.1 hypothetical protein PRIPAC_47186 [Pristionchus pacificus]
MNHPAPAYRTRLPYLVTPMPKQHMWRGNFSLVVPCHAFSASAYRVPRMNNNKAEIPPRALSCIVSTGVGHAAVGLPRALLPQVERVEIVHQERAASEQTESPTSDSSRPGTCPSSDRLAAGRLPGIIVSLPRDSRFHIRNVVWRSEFAHLPVLSHSSFAPRKGMETFWAPIPSNSRSITANMPAADCWMKAFATSSCSDRLFVLGGAHGTASSRLAFTTDIWNSS